MAIQSNQKGISEEIINENEVLVTAKAGENWHQFVMYCLDKNYGGLENLSFDSRKCWHFSNAEYRAYGRVN